MSESLPNAQPIGIQLCALPDDVLRVVGELLPPSGLIGLVRCSRLLAVLLGDELISRLNCLFAAQSSPLSSILSDLGTVFEDPAPSDRTYITGEATFLRFAEAAKGYDGPPYPGVFLIQECMLRYSFAKFSRMSFCRDFLPIGYHLFWIPISETSDTDAAKFRFVGWLQHRRRWTRWTAVSEALGNATASGATLGKYLGEFFLSGDSRNFLTNDED
jgi:hypothetical protein